MYCKWNVSKKRWGQGQEAKPCISTKQDINSLHSHFLVGVVIVEVAHIVVSPKE